MTVYFRYHLPVPLSQSSRKMHNPAIGSYIISNNIYLYWAAVTACSKSYTSNTFLLIQHSTLIMQIPLIQVHIVEPHIRLVIFCSSCTSSSESLYVSTTSLILYLQAHSVVCCIISQISWSLLTDSKQCPILWAYIVEPHVATLPITR
jgi:hypothetical protein